MSLDPAAFGPAPFRFAPTPPVLEAAAFSRTFRALATLLVIVACIWLLQLSRSGVLGHGGRSGQLWFAAALALLLITWWHILRSRTRLDAAALSQSWLWNKRLDLRELAYCKLIRVRGLEWLIAPRLYARTLAGKFTVFYTADPALLAEFERLGRELAEFRRL